MDKQELDPEEPELNVMIKIGSSNFRCSCTCNVFSKMKPVAEPDIYKCNSCGTEYESA